MNWISVKNEMPVAGRDVLIYWPYWSIRPIIGSYLSYGEWQSERRLSSEGPGPTHWMPLPNPPEKTEGK